MFSVLFNNSNFFFVSMELSGAGIRLKEVWKRKFLDKNENLFEALSIGNITYLLCEDKKYDFTSGSFKIGLVV